MDLKEHLKILIEGLLTDDDVMVDSLSVTRPTTDDPQASAMDNSVKQVSTGELYISVRAIQKPKS